jgi:regulator of CtrA degradation
MAQTTPIFLNQLYSESFDLLCEARNYFAYHPSAKQAAHHGAPLDQLYVNVQALRLTSRMTQAMAWLLAQRALQSGELSLEQACGGDFSLGGEEICTEADSHADSRLPASMQKLLNRSYQIYMRVWRLDQMTREKVQQTLQ